MAVGAQAGQDPLRLRSGEARSEPSKSSALVESLDSRPARGSLLSTVNRKVEGFEHRATSELSPPPVPAGPSQPPRSMPPSRDATRDVLRPPSGVSSTAIYKLYRGATAEVHGNRTRLWVEFPALQLCWAGYDLPAGANERASLLDLSVSASRKSADDDMLHVRAFSHVADGHGSLGDASQKGPASAAGNSVDVDDRALVLSASGASEALREFVESLEQLLASREEEGKGVLEFIQKRLFQYLWRHAGHAFTEEALYEAQAVLCFNLEPRQGVAYLRGKLGKGSDAEVGEWLAQMSTLKGGLDPTMLGTYFSRRDTLEVFKSFVRCLDFGGSDIVAALRQLFDTFKPGGEGQVITRILELFAEAYFIQWQSHKDSTLPKTAFASADSVLSVAVSLIMLNTGLHVAPKKNPGKRITGAAMSVEEYIDNTRRVVQAEEVPEEALRSWYDEVRQAEISVEPLPRVAFSNLPVQPDIEGWLVAVLGSHMHRRYWAVLALQRLYLFSDANDVEPADAIDLKDATVDSIASNRACRERFLKDLQSGKSTCMCFMRNGRGDLVDAEARAFEVSRPSSSAPAILEKLSKPLRKPRTRIPLVAESPDLMEKWVNLISCGPY